MLKYKTARGKDYRDFLKKKLEFVNNQLAARDGVKGYSNVKRIKGLSKANLKKAQRLIKGLMKVETDDLGKDGLDTVYGKYSPIDVSRKGRKANKGLDVVNVITGALTQSGYGDKLNEAMKALHNLEVIDAYEEDLVDPDFDYEVDEDEV